MRTTKVMAFSVPPQMERDIQRHAELEHRTVSEYLREAVRKYMELQQFEYTRKAISARLKKKKLKPSDVEAVVEEIRGRR